VGTHTTNVAQHVGGGVVRVRVWLGFRAKARVRVRVRVRVANGRVANKP